METLIEHQDGLSEARGGLIWLVRARWVGPQGPICPKDNPLCLHPKCSRPNWWWKHCSSRWPL